MVIDTNLYSRDIKQNENTRNRVLIEKKKKLTKKKF